MLLSQSLKEKHGIVVVVLFDDALFLVFHQEVLNGYADGSAAEYVVKVYAMLMAVLTMEKRQNSTHGSALGSAEMK